MEKVVALMTNCTYLFSLLVINILDRVFFSFVT